MFSRPWVCLPRATLPRVFLTVVGDVGEGWQLLWFYSPCRGPRVLPDARVGVTPPGPLGAELDLTTPAVALLFVDEHLVS